MDNSLFKAFLTVDFDLSDIAYRSEPTKVLMCYPDSFDVVDVKNIHMLDMHGKINKEQAIHQWQNLRASYLKLVEKQLISAVHTLPSSEGCEDMVFAANQSLPWLNQKVIMSNMFHSSRAREVKYFEQFYHLQDYTTLNLPSDMCFEGMGDTIPHPSKELLYGGYGHRTSVKAYEHVANLLACPVVLLEMIDERFYHLDTCFLPVNKDTVLICKEAFSEQALKNIRKCFPNVIEIDADKAGKSFDLNAHIIHSQNHLPSHAIIEQQASTTIPILEQLGLVVWGTDTSEYMKSGGSVFCMKMMYY